MTSLIYGTDTDNLEKILEVHEQGGSILCPVCGSKLLILNTCESATKYSKNPGMYCLKNENHVQIIFNLANIRNEFWRRFEQRMKSKEEDSNNT